MLTRSLQGLPPRQILALALAEKARRHKLLNPTDPHTEGNDPAKELPPEFKEQPSLVLTAGHPYHDLLHKKARYKLYKGGRGGAKSWAIGEALIRKASYEPVRILCTREYQNTIKDSVHKLLQDTIFRLGMQSWFHVTKDGIKSKAGAEFIFMGLHNNINNIKSAEGIDIVWIEEGQTIQKDTWKSLTPTIRKSGSEIWISMNPSDDDGVLEKFAANPPNNAIVHHVNFDSNPHFTQELEEERQLALRAISEADNDAEREQAQSDYDHIWLGMTKKISNEVILAGKVVVEGFPDDLYTKADRLLYGSDWGFAQDPATLIRSFILEECLYVEYEAYGTGVELWELADFFDSVPGSRLWPIKADSSRPETISSVRKDGFNVAAAEKWPGSVEDGIAHLRGFRKIIIHPRCKHTIYESKCYRYKVDRITGEVLPIIIDKNNHCIDAIRYSLDGYIQRRGDLGIWAKLGKS